MRAETLLTIAGAALTWAAFACSGDTQVNGTTGSSDTAGGTTGGSGSETVGSGTGGSGTTTADTQGESTGTGGTNSGSCPSIEPAVGSACAPEGQNCTFTNCVAPEYRDDHSLSCLDGAWALMGETLCEEEPTSCPSTPPVGGQTCDEATTPGPCAVVDACGSAQPWYCMDGIWADGSSGDAAPIAPAAGGAGAVGSAAQTATGTTGAVPELPPCPVIPPTLGSACCPANYPEFCDYGDGAGGGSNLVPAIGGASGTVGTVGGDGSIGAGGAGFGAQTTAGTTGSGGAVPAVDCVACSADMVWEASSDCP